MSWKDVSGSSESARRLKFYSGVLEAQDTEYDPLKNEYFSGELVFRNDMRIKRLGLFCH